MKETLLIWSATTWSFRFCPIHLAPPCAASSQIRKIAGLAYVGDAGDVFSPMRVSDPDMHDDTWVTHVSWCMPGSLTIGFLWSRYRHSRRLHNPQFYVSGKRPMNHVIWSIFIVYYFHAWLRYMQIGIYCFILFIILLTTDVNEHDASKHFFVKKAKVRLSLKKFKTTNQLLTYQFAKV